MTCLGNLSILSGLISNFPSFDAHSFAVDRKTRESGTDDPIAMGRHWLEIRKLRAKTKKTVDTKASKGTPQCLFILQ
jgi:hypothetical protein